MEQINVLTLKDYLIANPEAVLDLLAQLGFTNISHSKARNIRNEARFSKDEDSNPTAVRLNLDTMHYNCFSTNEYGDIFSLIMKKGYTFPQTLDYVTVKLGLSKKQFEKKTELPFGGFYKAIIKQTQEPECSMIIYNESILEPYKNKYNIMFLNDGIDFTTQEEFCVGYDIETMRITIPLWTLDGKLCGIMGRLNDRFCEKEDRWLPVIPCARNLTLYGYHKNYAKIQEKQTVIIGESEKFVQQMRTMGSSVGLATGGCAVSEVQAKYIKGLMIPKVIVAYDEGLDETQVRNEAEKLAVKNALYTNQVGYVYDRDNVILPRNSKASPTDYGRDKFLELVKNYTIWL